MLGHIGKRRRNVDQTAVGPHQHVLSEGVEAQVDWYESYADLDGERTKLQVFEMRSMASGGAFHRAYTHDTQQAFLEAHELAFRYFGGFSGSSATITFRVR